MKFFVQENSIVRKIWGKADTVLFIFAGAAAEFALNKAVDWLYFTGRLPLDPLGRLFSTVTYARRIVFSELEAANAAIESLRKIHSVVEQNRGGPIPHWAYRDVLFMLIYYSVAAYELLENKLIEQDKEEVYNVFLGVGQGMGLKGLPLTYNEWLPVREAHLISDLRQSEYTTDLFLQYKKHLGAMRYKVLIEAQKLVVPACVSEILHFKKFSLLTPVVPLYKLSRILKFDWLIKSILLPGEYKTQISEIDIKPAWH